MRYRWLRYRYAIVLGTGGAEAAGGLRPIGQAWQTGRSGMDPEMTLAQTAWRPPTDVWETAAAFTVTIELAGVDEDDLDALLYEDALVVEGRRRLPLPPTDGAGVYHAAEIRQGRFRVELALPAAIDPERADARYERGLLQITLQKTEAR